MYYIYILYSPTSDKYYVGYTTDPYRRVLEHNTKTFNTYTSKYRPWILAMAFACSYEEKEAIRIERFIKKQKSSIFINKIIEFEQVRQSLILKFK